MPRLSWFGLVWIILSYIDVRCNCAVALVECAKIGGKIYSMDIQYLINTASETMLTTGHLMPMAFLELRSNDPEQQDIDVILALDIFSDS